MALKYLSYSDTFANKAFHNTSTDGKSFQVEEIIPLIRICFHFSQKTLLFQKEKAKSGLFLLLGPLLR